MCHLYEDFYPITTLWISLTYPQITNRILVGTKEWEATRQETSLEERKSSLRRSRTGSSYSGPKSVKIFRLITSASRQVISCMLLQSKWSKTLPISGGLERPWRCVWWQSIRGDALDCCFTSPSRSIRCKAWDLLSKSLFRPKLPRETSRCSNQPRN